MSLLYLTLDRYSKYDPIAPISLSNPGGGMGPKTLSAIDVWRGFYDVQASEDINVGADILVVEPLWFLLRGDGNNLVEPDVEDAIDQYKSHPARIKILYTSELALLKLGRGHLGQIVDASTVVTTNCEFQRKLFDMYDILTMPLCDVTDGSYFDSDSLKRLSVMGMGRISHEKNSQKVVEIFKRLEGKIERVYFGSASLWGFSKDNDLPIESELKSHCDTIFSNVPQTTVVRELAGVSLAIFDTFHDCCSTSNLQALASGCLCFYGHHGLWKERPGIHGLETIDDFVEAIEEATDQFTCLPDNGLRIKAEEWAINNTSSNCFINEWQDIIKHANKTL